MNMHLDPDRAPWWVPFLIILVAVLAFALVGGWIEGH